MSDIESGSAPTPTPMPVQSNGITEWVKVCAFLFIPGAFLLTMCEGDKPKGELPTSTYRAVAEGLVRHELRDPGSAEFSDMKVIPGGGTSATIVCGKVNSRNGFGGMAGPERFIVGGTTAIESKVGADAMNQLWARFC